MNIIRHFLDRKKRKLLRILPIPSDEEILMMRLSTKFEYLYNWWYPGLPPIMVGELGWLTTIYGSPRPVRSQQFGICINVNFIPKPRLYNIDGKVFIKGIGTGYFLENPDRRADYENLIGLHYEIMEIEKIIAGKSEK